MITKIDTTLVKLLVEKNLIDQETLSPFIEEAGKSKDNLYVLLLRSGKFPEERLLLGLSEAMKVPLVELGSKQPDTTVIEKVPLKIAEYYKLVPLKIENRRLTIAISAPFDVRTQDDIHTHLGFDLDLVLAREKDVLDAIKRFYGFATGTINEMIASGSDIATTLPDRAFEAVENIEKLAGDASIAKLVNQIILEAFRKRATDIHLEPYRGKVKLRYRIDGTLYNANVPPEIGRFILPILSRIKIMSNLNIVEKRLPQDGRAIVKIEDTQLDLRVSSIPTPYGESVVVRMLPMNRVISLTQLGLGNRELNLFQTMIKKPHGIIFITGPTGSGKSTTLYACLNQLNSDDRKIITIEDPVEYEMEGVTQIQVAGNIGLDFAKGLRSILRHDPDVIMVGEVRDLETAETAIRVALTGHLVFSTLHTNDSASSVTRLVDIGVEPYLVSSSVEAFIAQRLVRTICSHCKQEDKTMTQYEAKKLIAKETDTKVDDVRLFYGKGCNQCNNTGFWGRVAIYEILLMNDKLRDLVMQKASAEEIKKLAVAQGMRTLRQDGWEKVLAGVTTPEEILKVAPADKAGEILSPELRSEEPVSTKEAAENIISRYNDRRQFERLKDTVNIRYRIIKSKDPIRKMAPSSEEYTVTKDVSAGGLLLVTRESIPVGSILELKVELPDGPPAIECLAKVMREEELVKENMFQLGICFLDLTGSQRARLFKYVETEGGVAA